MIQEQYVDFETARLLKSKGFDWQVNAIYAETKVLIKDRNTRYNFWVEPNGFFHLDYANYKAEGKVIKCPSLAMTMKWLREVPELFIEIHYDYYEDVGYKYSYTIKTVHSISKLTNSPLEWINKKKFNTYEEATKDAIKHCLTNENIWNY